MYLRLLLLATSPSGRARPLGELEVPVARRYISLLVPASVKIIQSEPREGSLLRARGPGMKARGDGPPN
jgi:hypothetical protein